MAPDVTYELSEDAFARYDSLLAAQGISVLPKSRDNFEVLDEPRESFCSIHGLVRHEDKEYRFTLRRDSSGFYFDLYAFEHGRVASVAVIAAVERAFPQPERGILRQRQPERPIEPGTFFTNYGCIFIIAFLVLVCVFAVIGVCSLFR